MAKKKKPAKPVKVKKPKATKAAKPARAAKTPKSWKSDRTKRALANVPRTPRDRVLPGLEDRAIRELEDIGAAYADIRDQRIRLSKEEGSLKDTARKVMHKHDKKVYRSKTIEIVLVDGQEDVKVKIRKDVDQDAPQTAPQVASDDSIIWGNRSDTAVAGDAGDAGDADEGQ